MMYNARLSILALFFLACSMPTLAQQDSIVFNNGNFIVGEAKSMDRGVLTVETDYSDSDFKIDWNEIAEIYTETFFLMTLSDGRRFNGTLAMAGEGLLTLNTAENGEVVIDLDELVFLTSIDEDFLSRLYANIDLGFSYAKARNFRQFSARFNAGYIANRWSLDGFYNSVVSNQDSVATTQRNEAGVSFRFFLPRDWYLLAQLNFLTNTEQRLDLRTTGKLGPGKYLVHTNSIYWGFQAGISFNDEDFAPDPENPDAESDRQSLEGFIGTEYNMYDVGDLSLLTNLVVYPSFTESGRWRADYNLDVKYDLPLDFYIRGGFSLNYDNQPVAGASETDYVITTSVGWSW